MSATVVIRTDASGKYKLPEIKDASKCEKRRRRRGKQKPVSAPPKPPKKPLSAWESLEEQISQIAGTSMFRNFQSTPLNARSSETFNRVMGDMKSKIAEQRAAIEAARRAREEAAVRSRVEFHNAAGNHRNAAGDHRNAAGEQHNAPDDDHDADDDDSECTEDEEEPVIVISPLRQAALRGWQILRRKMRDMTVERKKNNSSFNWSFLTHHLNNRNDHQKAREALYEKYIYAPKNWTEGLVNIPRSVLDKMNGRNAKGQSGTRSAMGMHTMSTMRPAGGRRPYTSPVKSNNRSNTKRFY